MQKNGYRYEYSRKVFLKVFFITGIFIGIVLLFIFLFFYSSRLQNNHLMKEMEKVLFTMESHPVDSTVIKTYRFFGTRYADMNECTFSVGQLRISKLDINSLRHMYSTDILPPNLKVRGVVFGFIPISEDSELSLDVPADSWHTRANHQINPEYNGYTQYIIYFYLPGQLWFGDERCLETSPLDIEINYRW